MLLLLAWAALPTSASAGFYNVWSCHTRSYAIAPIDGWVSTINPSIGYGGMRNSCPSGGSFGVGLSGEQPHPNQDHARMEFKPGVPGLVLHSASLMRSITVDQNQANAVVVAYISAPGPGYDGSLINNQYGAGTFGKPADPRSIENSLYIAPGLVGTPEAVIGATVACSSVQIAGLGCVATGTVTIYSAVLNIQDTVAPTVSSLSGDLIDRGLVGPVLSGQRSLVVQAADVGSGLLRAAIVVDGKDVATGSFGENGGRCVPDGPLDLRDFRWRQPCTASGSAALSWDTTNVGDGSHQVQVVAEDASGGRTVAATGTTTIKNAANVGPGSPLALRGEPNGSQAVDEAVIALSWPQTAKAPSTKKSIVRRCAASEKYRAENAVRCNGLPAKDTITGTWSKTKSHDLAGRLTTTAGTPIAGASIELSATVLAQGASPVALPNVTTDDDGRFWFSTARASGSMTIQAGWRARLKDTRQVVAAIATSTVQATTGLKAPARAKPGAKITFSGTLRGKAGNLAGVPVSLQSRNGGKWQTFTTISTDATGRWRKKLTFAKGRGNYRVRARVGTVATYPWAAGYSAGTVLVRVR